MGTMIIFNHKESPKNTPWNNIEEGVSSSIQHQRLEWRRDKVRTNKQVRN